MTDVHLIWYTIDDTAPTATRAQVREWADVLGLSTGHLSKGSLINAFIKACDATQVGYTDDEGEHVLTARETARKGEFTTFVVQREDGRKMAELKFFSARRTREGIVPGTHVIKHVVRTSLADAEKAACRTWIELAKKEFQEGQGTVPWYAIRRMMREGLLTSAVPLLRRRTAFFAYGDELDVPRDCGEFLLRIMENSEFSIIPIADHADFTLFSTSADLHLCEQADELLADIRCWIEQTHQARKRIKNALNAWLARRDALMVLVEKHESRMRLDLDRTRSSLLKADQLMTSLLPSSNLP